MQIEQADFDRIAEMIHSDSSPVGIDAKKTHIYIIHMLEQLQRRVAALEHANAEQGNSEQASAGKENG